MRDPARIEPFLNSLGAVWKQHPDLRFGQIIWLVSKGIRKSDGDPFYIEDHDFLRGMAEIFAVWEGAKDDEGKTRVGKAPVVERKLGINGKPDGDMCTVGKSKGYIHI